LAIERTLVQIRERQLFDLLDLSLVVVRNKPLTLGLAALLGIAPFAGFNVWLFGYFTEPEPTLPLFIWMLEAPFATAPLTVVLGGLMFGHRPRFLKVLGSVLQATFPLILVHGFLRFVLFFWIPTRLAFANEVILLERGKWSKILGRGADLSSGRAGELMALGVLQLLLTYVFAGLFSQGVSRIGQILMAEHLTWSVQGEPTFAGWRFQLPIWIVVAFFAVARFMAYIDQRIRLEGWEVELRLREVGEAMEEARRW
jgi:hypothetical protein